MSFWDSIVDKRACEKGATHRLVCCDAAQGTYSLPEERPLLPFLPIWHVRPSPQGNAADPALVEFNAPEMNIEQLMTLGSSWTSSTAETPFWYAKDNAHAHQEEQRRAAFVAAAQARAAAAQIPAPTP